MSAKIEDPAEQRVVVPLRIPWRAREELRRFAWDQGMSMNQVVITAVEAAIPGLEGIVSSDFFDLSPPFDERMEVLFTRIANSLETIAETLKHRTFAVSAEVWEGEE